MRVDATVPPLLLLNGTSRLQLLELKMPPKSKKGTSNDIGFSVVIGGQVESADFGGIDNLYCKYSFLFGKNWKILHGVDTGISQISRKPNSGEPTVVFNFPIDISFKSVNAYGWPRLVVSVYGIDSFGRDVVHGYGQMHLPTVPGQYVRYMRMFKPCSSSWWHQLTSPIFGNQLEFYDSKFVGQGENRDVTRVESTGICKIRLNMISKGMVEFGFTDADPISEPHFPNVNESIRKYPLP